MATNVMIDTRIFVRNAIPADIPGIAELIEPFVHEGKLLARTYDEFGELLPNFFVAVAVAKDTEAGADDLNVASAAPRERVVGCAALEIYSRKLAEIRSLAVHPDFQGHGVGKMLVDACIERARERNILEVMAITSSEHFFKSCGFDFTLPGEKKALFFQTRG